MKPLRHRILSTHLQLRVARFRLAGRSCQKRQHGLTHLRHARDQLGLCGVWILKFKKVWMPSIKYSFPTTEYQKYIKINKCFINQERGYLLPAVHWGSLTLHEVAAPWGKNRAETNQLRWQGVIMLLTTSWGWKSHPGLPGPEATGCTGASGARFSTLGAGDGAGEGAAESLVLDRSDPLSLENFT